MRSCIIRAALFVALVLSAGSVACHKAVTVESVAFDGKDLPPFNSFSVGVDNQTGRELGAAIVIDGHTVFSAVLLGDQHFGGGGLSLDLPAGRHTVQARVAKANMSSIESVTVQTGESRHLLFIIWPGSHDGEVRYEFKSSQKPFSMM